MSRFALAAALLAGAAACGGDDDDAEGSDTTTAASASDRDGTTTTPGTDATVTTTAGDDAAIDPNGTLRVATFTGYFWDPDKVTGGYSITQLALVYDRLVHTLPDGTLTPGLAESWEYGDDGLSLTFHLRDGVTFQDGEAFDAEVVKANLDRSLTLEGSSSAAVLARVREVVVVDPLTVELRLSSPDATLPAILSGAPGAMISPASLDIPDLDQKPVGAGMYRLVGFSPGSDYTVERWDGYWDPEAVQAQRIEFKVLPDSSARMNALRSGQVDIAPVEPADVAAFEGADDIEIRIQETLRYVYLAMNLAEAPLDDLKVRQAISMAIDRQALVDSVFHGFGEPTVQPWPSSYVGHVDGAEDAFPYDPERARELLAEAGYEDGFSAEIIAVPAPVVYLQLAEVVQAQLAEVGIQLEVVLTEPTQLGDAFYINKTSPFAMLYTDGGADPANTVGSRYAAEGFFNPGSVSTPRLEELYLESLSTTDLDARAEVFQEITGEVVDNVLDMPLFFAREPLAVSDRVVGYEVFLTGRPEYRGVGVTG